MIVRSSKKRQNSPKRILGRRLVREEDVERNREESKQAQGGQRESSAANFNVGTATNHRQAPSARLCCEFLINVVPHMGQPVFSDRAAHAAM
jgi:hypothetical protein